jgi:Major tropism determinant N-terminal domain
MSTVLQIKRGLAANLPTSAPIGELFYATDTNELFIGTGTGIEQLTNLVSLNVTEAEIEGAQAAGTNLTTTPINPVLIGAKGADGQLHVIATDNSGNLAVNVQNLPSTQAVTVSNFPATQTVSGAVSVSNLPATQPVSGSVSVSNFPATQPVSAASLPLPSGAATSAKQPAIGTAGTPSTDVITVQGASSMTPLKVDATGTTQPVSGTVNSKLQDGSGTSITSTSGALDVKHQVRFVFRHTIR